ncbi:hypothetical protein LDENG_00118590 [Lucifuga dentata]|nr:hypothetical protein LDENG_00118590 [Lucifuga dentata]
MAESRREEEEEEWRDLWDVRSTSQATDHPERTKRDHLHSSPGPLSSIRAAIKRTRTNCQSDHNRDRRRPEITILSAEPLASSNWFPGAAVVFSAPPPLPAQTNWSVSQLPPSYDQVIKEKTQEDHTVKPIAAPRRSTYTTTSATQTDPVKENTDTTVPQSIAAPPSKEKRSAGKKPQKPPRPSLPKLVEREPSTETSAATDENRVGTNTPTSSETQRGSKSDVKQPNQADSIHTRSVTVHWELPTNHLTKSLTASSPIAEAAPLSSEPEHNQCPIPLPRIKSRKQPITEEVETLVRISENCDNFQVASRADPEKVSSSKYLKELLEIFSAQNHSLQNCDVNQLDNGTKGDDAGGEMSGQHSQLNIRAKIQAFESQANINEGNVVEPAKQPEPPSKNMTYKPPVAAKPSLAFKPQFTRGIDNGSQEVSSTNSYQNLTLGPKPQPPKKPISVKLKDQAETPPTEMAIPPPSHLSVLTKAKSIPESAISRPTPPVKTFREPLKPNLNINNHNSTSMVVENEYVELPFNHTPIKPLHSVDSNDGSFAKQSISRRPTTIRVPSKSAALSGHFQDSPPPLPAQWTVGVLDPSVSHKWQTPNLPAQESFSNGPGPSLPPRPGAGKKTLPPRPPPAKTGPGRPPPPSLGAAGRSVSAPISPWEATSKPQTQQSQRKGPMLPPRPNPGHHLYNTYTLQLPHGIAVYDYNGGNTGELSFRKNEVILLLEEIDHNTFKCQVGDTKGRVQKSHIKVITPLTSVSVMSSPQATSGADSGRNNYELKVQAIYDFTPEGSGELSLRAGDVVTMVEQVDNEWYRGTCRGRTGFFPINYVKVLLNSPKPIPEKPGKSPSATVSGPWCVARFDFEGEHSDELSFSEGDVIQLKAYVGQDWARGQIGDFTGIFPLNFVEVIEDLPPPPSQQQTQPTRIALPGMAAPTNSHTEVAKPVQVSQSGVEWVMALYDFAGRTDGDLSFQKGDRILITQHVSDEWCCGRLNGSEGIFPTSFVESSTGQLSSNSQQDGAAGGGKAKALFNFTSHCDEELSLQVGDIITNLESIDEEWFLGDLRGKRALVPKNYVQLQG